MSLQPIPLLFPDVELWATGALRAALTARSETYAQGVFVSNSVPPARRDRMVIFRRDGGGTDGLLDEARLSMRVWATTEQDATDLARLCLALMWAAPDGRPVVSVRQAAGVSSIADPSGQPLRYTTLTVRSRGELLEGA